MYIKINNRISASLVMALLFLSIIYFLGRVLFQDFALPLLMIVIALLLLAVQLEMRKWITSMHSTEENNYKQLEALFSIFSTLEIKAPLPPTRKWAASPDFLKIIIGLINEKKPKVIVELGSGVSTLILGYAIKKMRISCVVISFDSNEHYANITRGRLKEHGLEDYIEVVFAPLKDVLVRCERREWYALDKFNLIKSIDMLIVDGPPTTRENSWSRYPALPLLFDKLSDRALIILDDANRDAENKIIKQWQKEYSGFSVEHFATEKGTSVLKKDAFD